MLGTNLTYDTRVRYVVEQELPSVATGHGGRAGRGRLQRLQHLRPVGVEHEAAVVAARALWDR